MSNHGLGTLSVKLTLLIHIPEGRRRQIWAQKTGSKDTGLVTKNSEIRTRHCEVTERIPMDCRITKRCSFAPFTVYCYNTMWQISHRIFDEMGWRKQKNQSISHKILIPVAARSKAWVCSRSLAGFAGSNPARITYVCLLWVLCVVRYRSLRRADHSSRGFLSTVVCLSVIAKPGQRWGPAPTVGLAM
jgi:hypothetical protein